MRSLRLLSPLLVAALAWPGAAAVAEAPDAVVAGPPRIELSAPGSYPFERGRAAIAGQSWAVRGTTRPYAAGKRVIVRFYRGDKLVRTARARVRKAKGGRAGNWKVEYRTGRPGALTVRAVRPAAPKRPALRSTTLRVTVVSPRLRFGSRGPAVRFFQRRLLQMGYWAHVNGVYDAATGRAVMAYRRVNRMRKGFGSSIAIYRRVAAQRGGFHPRYRATGRQRVEADLRRQVVALINAKGRVWRVLYTSSGKSSTPSDRGRFRFYMKRPGTNAKGMIHSAFYHGGEAIHGYPSVPNYPASHGCLRIPPPNALTVMRWVRLGDRIDVYR